MLIYFQLLEEGERESFKKIYEENYLKMYHVALSKIKHKEDAENAVHDAFIKLAENFKRYKHLNTQEMTSLCIVIVKNKAIDILRKRKFESDKDIVDDLHLVEPDISSIFINNETNERVTEILDSMNEPLKLVLILKYFHDYKNSEIAKILDISQRAVEMRLYRAKYELRRRLLND